MKNIFLLTLLVNACFTLHAQDFEWAVASSGQPLNERIATDKAGNSYICGSFNCDFTMTQTITGNCSNDGYLVKLDPLGVEQWLLKIGGDYGDDDAYDVTTDQSGNIYVVGSYEGDIMVGNIPLNGGGAFLIKVAPSGSVIWANTISPVSTAQYVVCGDSAALFVGGYAFSSTDIGCGSDITQRFFARLDTAGNCHWVHTANPTYLLGIASDHHNNLYATGAFANSTTFGNTTLYASGSQQSVYLAKCNSEGWQWAKKFGSAVDHSQGHGIDVDGENAVLLTGYFSGVVDFGCDVLTAGSRDIFILKLDSAGNCQWVQHAGGGSGVHYAFALAADHYNNCFISGSIIDVTHFGNNTITPDGENFYVAKYDESGVCQWAVESTLSNDRGRDVSCDSLGNVYAAGELYEQGSYLFGTIPIEVPYYSQYYPVLVTKIASVPTGIIPLDQNTFIHISPNPFSVAATISFSLPQNTHVLARLYDVSGRELQTIMNGNAAKGPHELQVNREDMPPGIYILKLRMDDEEVRMKLVIQ